MKMFQNILIGLQVLIKTRNKKCNTLVTKRMKTIHKMDKYILKVLLMLQNLTRNLKKTTKTLN